MTTESEKLSTELDAFMTSALSIHDVAKVLPHPYNAVSDMASKWAHDFVSFALSLQKRVERMEANLTEATRGWDDSSEAWSQVQNHPAVRAQFMGKHPGSLMTATLAALDKVEKKN
jgi:hypothetical protein